MPTPCISHVDPKLWRDEPPANGLIKTVCSVCGKFIGYRPAIRAIKESKVNP